MNRAFSIAEAAVFYSNLLHDMTNAARVGTLSGDISSGYIYTTKPEDLITKVIFNDPATIVMWKDGTKTVVKAGEGEIFDPEKGLAMAISKKALGNKGSYYDIFKKWLPEEKKEPFTVAELISEVCKSKGVPVYVEDIEDAMGAPNGFYMKFDGSDDTKHTCMDCKYGELTPGDDPCRQCAPMRGYPMWTAKDDMSSFCSHCVHDLDSPPKDDYHDKAHVQSCFEIRDEIHVCTTCRHQDDSVHSEWCEECLDRYSHPNWESKEPNI